MVYLPKVLPFSWAVLVCVLHLIKVDIDPDREKLIPHADKIVHFCMFAGMGFLFLRSAIFHGKKASTKNIIIVVVSCLCYGALLEYLQSLSSGVRSGDFFDWIADGFGAVAGALMARSSWLPFLFRHQIGKSS